MECPTGTVTYTTLTHLHPFPPKPPPSRWDSQSCMLTTLKERKRRVIKSNSYESHLSSPISCITAFNKACFILQPSSGVPTRALVKVLVLNVPLMAFSILSLAPLYLYIPPIWISAGESFLLFPPNLFHTGQACGCHFHARVNQDEPMLFAASSQAHPGSTWLSVWQKENGAEEVTAPVQSKGCHHHTVHRTAALTPLLTLHPPLTIPAPRLAKWKLLKGRKTVT